MARDFGTGVRKYLKERGHLCDGHAVVVQAFEVKSNFVDVLCLTCSTRQFARQFAVPGDLLVEREYLGEWETRRAHLDRMTSGEWQGDNVTDDEKPSLCVRCGRPDGKPNGSPQRGLCDGCVRGDVHRAIQGQDAAPCGAREVGGALGWVSAVASLNASETCTGTRPPPSAKYPWMGVSHPVRIEVVADDGVIARRMDASDDLEVRLRLHGQTSHELPVLVSWWAVMTSRDAKEIHKKILTQVEYFRTRLCGGLPSVGTMVDLDLLDFWWEVRAVNYTNGEITIRRCP